MKKRLLCLLLSVGMIIPTTVVNAEELTPAAEEQVFAEATCDPALEYGLLNDYNNPAYQLSDEEGELIELGKQTTEDMLGDDLKTIDLAFGNEYELQYKEGGNTTFFSRFTTYSKGYLRIFFPMFTDTDGNKDTSFISLYNAAGQRVWAIKLTEEDPRIGDIFVAHCGVAPGSYTMRYDVKFRNTLRKDTDKKKFKVDFYQTEYAEAEPNNTKENATVMSKSPKNAKNDQMYNFFFGGKDDESNGYDSIWMKFHNDAAENTTSKIYFVSYDEMCAMGLSITLQHATQSAVTVNLRNELKADSLREGESNPRYYYSMSGLPEGDYYITINGPRSKQLYFLASIEDYPYQLPFPQWDMPSDDSDWRYEPVSYVYKRGWMTGSMWNGQLTFGPKNPITREEFVTILFNIDGRPTPLAYTKFNDVTQGKWYSDPISYCKNNKIVEGYTDTRFGLGRNITRQEIACMLFNYAKFKDYDVSGRTKLEGKFVDAFQVDKWANDAMQWAVDKGIINGKLNNNARWCAPKDNATRAETAAMIMNFAKKYMPNR